ncbi:MAG: UDP-N-acetylmuramoyl-tripeptide--D-alanyl-D-alanine ligase [Ginsengibacter sp.]
MDINSLYEIFLKHPDVTTDTRNIKKGQIFFALKGPSFNGNNFARTALEYGAAFSVVDEDVYADDVRILRVNNSLEALQQLAKHHRLQFNIPFIAITGSNGKTTTKELMGVVLSSKYKTYITEGNLNNHIGVPLTILKIKQDAEMAIIEMGANHQKEIESYCQYAMPTHGLITNCGKAHLEGFGGVEGVIKGKGELFQYIKEHSGTAFVNNNDNAIVGLSQGIKNIIAYGPDGQINGIAKDRAGLLQVQINSEKLFTINTQMVGDYNLPNVLAAVAVGKHFKVSDDKIITAIENYSPSNSRSQAIKLGTNTIILDAYNANPSSMKVAVENFSRFENANKILMLGAMMELGDESVAEHKALVALIDKYDWDNVVLVGSSFKELNHKYTQLNDSSEAKQWFQDHKIENSAVLIKGSRSMKMEKIIE